MEEAPAHSSVHVLCIVLLNLKLVRYAVFGWLVLVAGADFL